jgi:hypothetical protein
MSLLRRCLLDPRSIYAFNDALIRKIGAENPHVTSLLVARLCLWNMAMWRCPRMPPCMAVLVLFWLAEAHEGVQIMFVKAEGDDTRWRDEIPALFRLTSTLITDIASRNITERSTVRRALQFYASLLYVVMLRRLDLIHSTPTARAEKVAFQTKGVLMKAWLAKQTRKGRPVAEADAVHLVADEDHDDDESFDESSSDDDS